jgi:hypothetical protein
MTFLLAAACGLIAVNLYSAKPFAGSISAAQGAPGNLCARERLKSKLDRN